MAKPSICFLEIDTSEQVPKIDLRPRVSSLLVEVFDWAKTCKPGDAFVLDGSELIILCLNVTRFGDVYKP